MTDAELDAMIADLRSPDTELFDVADAIAELRLEVYVLYRLARLNGCSAILIKDSIDAEKDLRNAVDESFARQQKG